MAAFEKGHLPEVEIAAKRMETLEKEYQSKVEATVVPGVPPGQFHPPQAGVYAEVYAGCSLRVISPQPIPQSKRDKDIACSLSISESLILKLKPEHHKYG